MQAVADLGEGSRRPRAPPPLFVDQTEVQRAKINFWDAPTPPPPLSKGLDPPLAGLTVLVIQGFFLRTAFLF